MILKLFASDIACLRQFNMFVWYNIEKGGSLHIWIYRVPKFVSESMIAYITSTHFGNNISETIFYGWCRVTEQRINYPALIQMNQNLNINRV